MDNVSLHGYTDDEPRPSKIVYVVQYHDVETVTWEDQVENDDLGYAILDLEWHEQYGIGFQYRIVKRECYDVPLTQEEIYPSVQHR